MIEWLTSFQWPLSLTLTLLLLLAGPLLKWLGPLSYYRLFALVPLSMLASLLPKANAPTLEYMVRATTLVQASARSISTSDSLLWIWLAGMVIFVGLTYASHRAYLQQLNLRPVGDRRVLGHRLAGVSDRLGAPLLTGLWKPRLILPGHFTSHFSLSQQKLMLRHEHTHAQRGDLLWNLLALALLGICWFNPLCWLGYARFRQAQELACDHTTLDNHDKATRLAYARALLDGSTAVGGRAPLFLHYGEKSMLTQRLKQLRSVAPRRPMATLFCTLALSASVTLMANAGNKHEKDMPHPLKRVDPQYPAMAAKKGTQGSVDLRFTIEKSGKVSDIEVVDAKPSGVFEKAAIRAVSQWQYQPQEKAFHSMLVRLDFRLAPEGDDKVHNARQGAETIRVSQ